MVNNNITVIAAGKHHASDSEILLPSKELEGNKSSYANMQADLERDWRVEQPG